MKISNLLVLAGSIRVLRRSVMVASVLSATACLAIGAYSQQPLPGNFRPPVIPKPTPQEIEQSNRLVQASDAGEALLKQQKWDAAIQKFREAQAIDKYYGFAFYGLAQAYAGKGQLEEAVAQFRLLYGVQVDEKGNRHFHHVHEPTASMDYAVVLSRMGRDGEAVAVYNNAADALNYQDAASTGKPHLKVLLPTFGTGAGQTLYTARRLQAMALIATKLASGSPVADVENILAAARLYPDSAVSFYYLGEQLSESFPDEARAAYQKATQLPGEQAHAAAREALTRLPPPGQAGYLPAPAAVRQLLGLAQPPATPTAK